MNKNKLLPPSEQRYDAIIGAGVFVLANYHNSASGKSLGTLKGLPTEPRIIWKFDDGAALSLCPYEGEDQLIWKSGRAWCGNSSTSTTPEDVSWLIKYEYEGQWSKNLVLSGSMEIIRLAAQAVQIAGPYIGHPYYLAYAKIKDTGKYEFCPHTLVFPRFTPELFCGFWGIGDHDLDFDHVIKLCGQLMGAFSDSIGEIRNRWKAKSSSERKGTRLQASLELYSQSMRYIYAQDSCIRLHMALEALFACKAFNKATLALICPLLLQGRLEPTVCLNSILTIFEWRNKFFHGDEPPYQDPSGAPHMDSLRDATNCGVLLLRELYQAILGSQELLVVFNSRLDDKSFMESLFKALLSNQAT